MSCIRSTGQAAGGLFDELRRAEHAELLRAERGEERASGAPAPPPRAARATASSAATPLALSSAPGWTVPDLLRRERGVAAEAEVVVVRADDDALARDARGRARASTADDVRGGRPARGATSTATRARTPSGREWGRPSASPGARRARATSTPAAQRAPPRSSRTATMPGARGDLPAPGREVVRAPRAPRASRTADDRGGAVLARVDRLVAPLAVAVARAGRGTASAASRLAREVLRDEDDLPLHVEPGVVVVAELRRGDPVARRRRAPPSTAPSSLKPKRQPRPSRSAAGAPPTARAFRSPSVARNGASNVWRYPPSKAGAQPGLARSASAIQAAASGPPGVPTPRPVAGGVREPRDLRARARRVEAGLRARAASRGGARRRREERGRRGARAGARAGAGALPRAYITPGSLARGRPSM